MFERIDDIKVDYQNGILEINGQKVDIPVKVVVKESSGWDIAKVFNADVYEYGKDVPEVIIDARAIQNA